MVGRGLPNSGWKPAWMADLRFQEIRVTLKVIPHFRRLGTWFPILEMIGPNMGYLPAEVSGLLRNRS